MAAGHNASYDDGRIVCDDRGLLIRWYYLWGAKRIPYAALRGLNELPLTGRSRVRRWRLWGSGDFLHWWNLDPGRPKKTMALVLDIGHHVRPTITPDNPDSVERILRGRMSTR